MQCALPALQSAASQPLVERSVGRTYFSKVRQLLACARRATARAPHCRRSRRPSEHGMVEDIEILDAEIERDAFGQIQAATQRDVSLADAEWASQGVANKVARRAVRS